ncbi:MAG: DUF3368 domain-containing protein [Chloroflexi bacterium]|nr:DUF3368 domain-containing protein [Chloroflexota bacterium]
MIVVSNTSPLTNLAAIGQFDLLHKLYGEIHMPLGVWDELNAGGKRWPGRDEVARSDWVKHHTVQNRALVTALLRDLESGEAESIALCLELAADLLLMDEKEGRRAAERHGLNVIGVVGVLIEAKANGFVNHVRPYLDALRRIAGFRLRESLYSYVLTIVHED